MKRSSDYSNFLQRVTFPWPLNSELTHFGKNSNFNPSLGQSGHSILKSRYLLNRWSDFSNVLQRVTFPWPLSSELRNFGQNSNLIPFTPYLGQWDRSILKPCYLVNRWSDYSEFFLQRVTFPWSLNCEFRYFGQNSNLTPITASLGQLDRSILKSRYLLNRWSDFSIFFQPVKFPWPLSSELTHFGQNSNLTPFSPSLGQSDRSILKSRYLVNHWSDFSIFLQRVTFPWSLNSEFRYFGQNSNMTPFTPHLG